MKYKDELTVGIVVFIALVLFTVGLIAFGDYEIRAKKYIVRVLFSSVEGLQRGDPVTLAGVKVGNVKALSFYEQNRRVLVDITVRSELQIPDDSHAYVVPVGMMGEKAIHLRLGDHQTMIHPGDIIQGGVVTDLAQLTASAAPIMNELQDILERIRELLDQQTEMDIRESLKNMGEMTTGMRKIVTNDLHNVGKVMEDVEGVASNLRDLSEGKKARIDTVLAHVEETSRKLTTLTESLTTTSESLGRVAERLNRGEGTLGKLLVDDGLYERVERVVSRVDSLTQDIKAHPERYLQIRVF
ncbi:MAG: MCE family protein [Candidatus Latescibacteria bacterium]|nr:MCE family protein [Candidatus Latescibacterota bacterium]